VQFKTHPIKTELVHLHEQVPGLFYVILRPVPMFSRLPPHVSTSLLTNYRTGTTSVGNSICLYSVWIRVVPFDLHALQNTYTRMHARFKPFGKVFPTLYNQGHPVF